MLIRQTLILVCLLAGSATASGATFLEDFNSVPPGNLVQRIVGPITVTFSSGTYSPGGFSVLDAFVGHHSQLEPSRALSDLDILLSFNSPLQEFSILDDPATNEPGANQINVIALASDFSVLGQATFPNDQLPQSRVTVSVPGIDMIVLDIVPIPGTPDDEGFDDMLLTPLPEPGALTLAGASAVTLLGLGLRRRARPGK